MKLNFNIYYNIFISKGDYLGRYTNYSLTDPKSPKND